MPFLAPEMPLAATIAAEVEETIAAQEIMHPAASKPLLRIFNNLHEGSITYEKQIGNAARKPSGKKQGSHAEAPWRQL